HFPGLMQPSSRKTSSMSNSVSVACGLQSCLQCLQVLLDFRIVPVLGATELTAKLAFAVDHVGLGKLVSAINRTALLGGVAHRDESDIVVPYELVVSGAVHIHADSQHGDVV